MKTNTLHHFNFQAKVKGVPCRLLTSHLESTKDSSSERKRQLRTALSEMTKAPSQQTVIFGGDLNLRDKEVKVHIFNS